MAEKITKNDVAHIAHLARLKLTDDELELFETQLKDILGYVGQLNELDLKDIPPTSYSSNIKNVFREDKIKEPSNREEILKNAPLKSGEYFKVKKVIE